MMFNFGTHVDIWQPVYAAQDLTAWNPKLWARESIAILEETMVYGSLVHRDFNTEVAGLGDIVNTRKPAEFETQIHALGDTVSYQDAHATNVQVKLDTVADVSFLIRDLEQSYSFTGLVQQYLQPAILAIARTVDRKIAGQAAQFLANTAGGMGSGISQNTLVDTEEVLNNQKVSDVGRNLVVSSSGKADILKSQQFTKANEAGTDNALRRALMGDLFGMDTYLSINTAKTLTGTTSATNSSAATVAGVSAISTAGAVAVGAYFTVIGDMTPLRVASTSGTYDLVTTRPIREATAAGTGNVTIYTQGTVNGTYAAGYTKAVQVDGTGKPSVGQLVSFGATAPPEYVIVQVSSGTDNMILLDRPLDLALANNDVVNYGPIGSMNLAFHRNAIALVNRPLEAAGMAGANMATASSRNVAIRVATSWDQDKKALKVSVDSLFGVKTLDAQYGAVLLS